MLNNTVDELELFVAFARGDRAVIARYLRDGGPIDQKKRLALAEFIENSGRRIGERRGRRSGKSRWTMVRRAILGIAVENLRQVDRTYEKKDAAIRAISEVTGYSERSIWAGLSQY